MIHQCQTCAAPHHIPYTGLLQVAVSLLREAAPDYRRDTAAAAAAAATSAAGDNDSDSDWA